MTCNYCALLLNKRRTDVHFHHCKSGCIEMKSMQVDNINIKKCAFWYRWLIIIIISLDSKIIITHIFLFFTLNFPSIRSFSGIIRKLEDCIIFFPEIVFKNYFATWFPLSLASKTVWKGIYKCSVSICL